MLFNVDKYKVIHLGYNNTWASYYRDNIVLHTCTVVQEINYKCQGKDD